MELDKENLPRKAALCSEHFQPNCFSTGGGLPRKKRILPTIIGDSLGLHRSNPNAKRLCSEKLPLARNLVAAVSYEVSVFISNSHIIPYRSLSPFIVMFLGIFQ